MLDGRKHRAIWEMTTRKTALIFLVVVLATVCGTVIQHVGAGGREEERRESGAEPSVRTRDEVDFAPARNAQRKVFSKTYQYARKPESAYTSCPDGYPTFGKLGEMLRAWSPNEPDVPEGGVIERLQSLNYSIPAERAMAEKLRDCEVPFKVYGFPAADAASEKWTDEYLHESMRECPRCNVMRSESNRFMFWHKPRSPGVYREWEPPTKPNNMGFEEWRMWTRKADASKIGPDEVHYYLTVGVSADLKTPPLTDSFIANDLSFFSTKTNNFFVTDVTYQKGIQCRFGGRGIIAESHFDHGRNFILMLRGRKRYLLNPPQACPNLGILKEKQHPSFRHSEVDWADESDWPEGFAEAPALETVLEAGEFLYVPSFWYHYIVSERYNVQCNARSGISLREAWINETESCMGREFPTPDEMKTSRLTPLGRGKPRPYVQTGQHGHP